MATGKRSQKPAKRGKQIRAKAPKKSILPVQEVSASESAESAETEDEPSLELQLRRAIAELGLSEARRIFAALEQTFSR
jgi:hypothetical protein